MKKVIVTVAFAFCLMLVGGLTGQASAATDVLNNGGSSSPCSNPDATGEPSFCADNGTGKPNPIFGSGSVLSEVTAIILYIVGVLAVIMIIISGIRMVTANGDSNAFNSARTGLIYSVLGLVVAVLARAIILFIVSKL